MGFRNLTAFNQALLAKQVWRIIRNPNSIVAKLFKAKYFHDRDIMEAKISSNSSFVWRSMMWGRDLIKEGLRWRVGDGRDVKIFKDAWLPTFPNGKFFIRREEMVDMCVADLLDENSRWDRGKMAELLLPFEVEEVLRIERDEIGLKDRRFWKFDSKGEYSVKAGYLVASNYFAPPNACAEDGNVKWWKYLWSFDLPPRVRIFAWRVFRNFVPMEMNLRAHHVPVHGRCNWCRKGWGNTSHVLIFCSKVRSAWVSFEFWKLLKKWEDQDMSVIGEVMRAGTSREEFAQWIMGLWIVWKGLCDEKHKEKRFSGDDLRRKCDDFIDGNLLARQQAALQNKLLPNEGSSKWKSPRSGRFRLDVDYAVDEVTGKGGIGAILRDDKARIIFALAKPVAKSMTVLHGELKAAMFGICQCVEEGISPIEVFSDSILAVHILEEKDEDDSILCEDMSDFFAMVKNLNVISFNHVRREANKAAHELASLAKTLVSSALWHDCWPLWLLEIVSFDSS